jgi:hypothetical protein
MKTRPRRLCRRLLRYVAPVDDQFAAGYERRLIRRQVQHPVGHVVGFAGAANV